MLDRKFILENETLVAENCRNRGVEVDVQKLVALEQQRRQVQADAEEANRLANAASKAIGKAADEAERELRKEEGRKLREEKETLHAQADSLESQSLKFIPGSQTSLTTMHPSVPMMQPIVNYDGGRRPCPNLISHLRIMSS